MGRIVVSDNVTVDGVMQDPAGDEGFERGGWVGLIAERPELGRFALLEATTSDAMLMGRRTYEWFAGRWPSRTGELADRLNSMPKYVVSSSLEVPAWANTTLLRGEPVEEVKRLRAEIDGDIVIPASVSFIGTLQSTAWSTSCGCASSRCSWARARACSGRPAPRDRCASLGAARSMATRPP